jgi:hypothetical protein
MVPIEPANGDVQATQQRLAAASLRLSMILDNQWKAYLAIPPEAVGGPRPPTAESLALTIARFQNVTTNPQFNALAQRPEFLETLQLLQQLSNQVGRTTITLPPPPR